CGTVAKCRSLRPCRWRSRSSRCSRSSASSSTSGPAGACRPGSPSPTRRSPARWRGGTRSGSFRATGGWSGPPSALSWFSSRGDPGPPGQLPNAAHLRVDGVGVILLLIVSYVSFLAFINGTTMSYLRAQTEIDLAHEIHQVLVPAIAARVGDCEFVGFSAASGEVGGDLVDVVPLDEGWFGSSAHG